MEKWFLILPMLFLPTICTLTFYLLVCMPGPASFKIIIDLQRCPVICNAPLVEFSPCPLDARRSLCTTLATTTRRQRCSSIHLE